MKRLILLLSILLILPASANELDKAMKSGNDVLMYFYSPTCISCDKFNPIYFELEKEYKNIKFVRINIDTNDGRKLFSKYHGFYIPYLTLTSPKTKKTVSITAVCASNDVCFERVLKGFRK